MKLLNRDTDVTRVDEAVDPGEGYETLPEAPDFACPSCGAGMIAGQDWCLECGTAAPGRLGTKPGWRAALTVTSITVLLVLGAVIAAYAGMSTDATRDTRDGQPNGLPNQAQVPPPPAPGAATNTPPATGEAPAVPAPRAGTSDSAAVPVPPGDGGAIPAPGGGGDGAAPAPGGGDGGGGAAPAPGGGGAPVPSPGGGGGGGPAPVRAIALAAGSGSIYDPSDRKGARFSDPTGAYDGTERYGFTISAPDDGDPFGAGIAFRLPNPRRLTSLEVLTKTPGYTVEVYGSASGKRPPDILDNRWTQLGRSKVKSGRRISLNSGGSGRVRHVAVWVTSVPSGTGAEAGETRRTVSLNELRFRGR